MGRPFKIDASREQLVDLYVTQGKTQLEIGRILGIHQVSVGYALKHYGIKARGPGKPAWVILPRDELTRFYRDEHWTLSDLRDHYKCGFWTIQKNLERYGLSRTKQEKKRVLWEANKKRLPFRMLHYGYWMAKRPDHPAADSCGYVPEHRLAIEEFLGRQLPVGIVIHHINRQRQDNRVENLAVFTDGKDHMRAHRYMEMVGIYLIGFSDIRPAPLTFDEPVFWGGQYVTTVDLISESIENYRLHLPVVRGVPDKPTVQ